MIRIICLAFLINAAGCNSVNNEVYVSPEGNDLNSGLKQSPFASLDRAIEEVRKLKNGGNYPETGINWEWGHRKLNSESTKQSTI